MSKPQLTLPLLKTEAKKFAKALTGTPIVTLYGMDNLVHMILLRSYKEHDL